MTETDSHRKLVDTAAAGDEVAFARIVARHHDDLARIAYFVCGDLDVAEEAEQSTWAIAYRRLKDLRDPASLRPWLMAIAANEARQIMRDRRRRGVREISVRDGTQSRDHDQAAMIDLADALARLDPQDRAIVGLRFIAGFDSEEIGRAVGLTPSNVRTRLHRLLERLRRDLEHD